MSIIETYAIHMHNKKRFNFCLAYSFRQIIIVNIFYMKDKNNKNYTCLSFIFFTNFN